MLRFKRLLTNMKFNKIIRNLTDDSRHSTSGDTSSATQKKKIVPVFTGERGVNKAILMGRVGGPVEVRGTTENPVSIFSLATSQSFKDIESGEYTQQTQWHRIAIFRPTLREMLQRLLEKGDRAYVSGTINYYQKIGDDNKNVTLTSIVADDVIIIGKSPKSVNFPEDM